MRSVAGDAGTPTTGHTAGMTAEAQVVRGEGAASGAPPEEEAAKVAKAEGFAAVVQAGARVVGWATRVVVALAVVRVAVDSAAGESAQVTRAAVAEVEMAGSWLTRRC